MPCRSRHVATLILANLLLHKGSFHFVARMFFDRFCQPRGLPGQGLFTRSQSVFNEQTLREAWLKRLQKSDDNDTRTYDTVVVSPRSCCPADADQGWRGRQAHGVSVQRQPDQGGVVRGGRQHDPEHGRRAQHLPCRREGRGHRQDADRGPGRGRHDKLTPPTPPSPNLSANATLLSPGLPPLPLPCLSMRTVIHLARIYNIWKTSF